MNFDNYTSSTTGITYTTSNTFTISTGSTAFKIDPPAPDEKIYTPCPDCTDGTVVLADGTPADCGACDGTGRTWHYRLEETWTDAPPIT